MALFPYISFYIVHDANFPLGAVESTAMESLILSFPSTTERILHLINTVATLDRPAKFQYLCNLPVQFDEHIVDITAKSWELLEGEELWKESFAL